MYCSVNECFNLSIKDKLVCRYEAYKKEYITTKKKVYFKKHKDDDWQAFEVN